MPSFTTILASTGLAGLALALPQSGSPKVGFTVNQSVAKPFQPGPVRLAHAYSKYGATPPSQVAAAAAASSGSVTATPEQYDSSYLCPVTLGSDTLNLDFDTGSADLWVFSNELSSSTTAGHDIYHVSSTKKLSGYTWKISYGDGSSASGDVYQDTVKVGGTTVTKQAVEAAQTVSAQFAQDQNNDGLLGLAFSSINTVQPNQQNTFFDTAINQGLPKALFTVDLKAGKPGSYGFGYIDSSKYTGSITYANVDSSQGFWQFTSSGYGVGSTFKSGSISGIADTGTTLLLLPDSVVNAYYAKVSGAYYDNNQGGYVFPCRNSLPNFVVGVGSSRYTIPGSYMNYAPVDNTNCYGGLQSSSGIGINIYGDIFLKAVFMVFDKTTSTPRLGFASKSL